MLEVENKIPNGEMFQFKKVKEGLQRMGSYLLEYVLSPALPGLDPLRVQSQFLVEAGAPVSFAIQVQHTSETNRENAEKKVC